MPVVSVTSDPETLAITAVGEYPVPVERLWAAWADPRQLERFWGPPRYPATFTRHDLRVGGRSEYHLTGPSGEVIRGSWVFDRVEAPTLLEVSDGFDDGRPSDVYAPMRMRFTFERTVGGSRFVGVTRFASLEAMEQMVVGGMVEGLSAALAQIDDVVADPRAASTAVAGDAPVRITSP